MGLNFDRTNGFITASYNSESWNYEDRISSDDIDIAADFKSCLF